MEAGTDPSGTGRKHSLRDDAKEAVHDAADTVRREAGEVLGSLKGQARELVDDQKAMAADRIHGIASALRKASEELESQRNTAIAGAFDHVADSVDNVAGRVRSESMGDLFRRAENFSRRNPSVVLGGAALASFMFARFVRASGRSYETDDYREIEEGATEGGRPY